MQGLLPVVTKGVDGLPGLSLGTLRITRVMERK